MEQGNEGDEIILLSLRQIECSIPPEVSKNINGRKTVFIGPVDLEGI